MLPVVPCERRAVMDEEEEWTKISTDGLYTPGEADVGHCLRLECRAVLPTGEEVCTPRMITTEPVLSSESVSQSVESLSILGGGVVTACARIDPSAVR